MTTISGCKASEGCEKKEQCERYHRYLESTPYRGFSAHHLCRNTEFREKHYEHFVEINKTENNNKVIILYIVAIILANFSVAVFGPSVSPINAFLLIGLDLTVKDYLQINMKSPQMFLIIIASGVISYVLNPAMGMIAISSVTAFIVSSLVDYGVFSITKGSWIKRANSSNIAGAVVDSLLFPTIAFGAFMPMIVVMQIIAKVSGGFLFSLIINKRVIHEHLPS